MLAPPFHGAAILSKIVLMSVTFQCGDITAVAITVDYAAIGKGSVGKFFTDTYLRLGVTCIFR